MAETLRSVESTESPELIKERNIQKIDSVLNKLWYERTTIDARSWLKYSAVNDAENTLSLYWGIRWVPKNWEISQEQIIGELFDSNPDIRNSATKEINNLLWTKIPEKRFDEFGINSLSDYIPYILNIHALPYYEYKDVQTAITQFIYDRTQGNISIDDFSFTNNTLQSSQWFILMINGSDIDQRWWERVSRVDLNFHTGEVKLIP